MTLYLVGSAAPEAGAEVLEQFCTSAKKRGSRVVIVASPEDPLLPQLTAALTDKLPDDSTEILALGDDGLDVTHLPDQISGIIVLDAATATLLTALTPHRDAIADLIRRGVPYLGYARGATIIGRHVVTGGWQYQGRQVAPEAASQGISELTIETGLGIVGPTIEVDADTHSLLERAIAAIEASTVTTVAALDHDAALVLDVASGRTRVLGAGLLTWVSASQRRFVVTYDRARK